MRTAARDSHLRRRFGRQRGLVTGILLSIVGTLSAVGAVYASLASVNPEVDNGLRTADVLGIQYSVLVNLASICEGSGGQLRGQGGAVLGTTSAANLECSTSVGQPLFSGNLRPLRSVAGFGEWQATGTKPSWVPEGTAGVFGTLQASSGMSQSQFDFVVTGLGNSGIGSQELWVDTSGKRLAFLID